MIFITGNEEKLREFEEILGRKLGNAKLDLEEIQSIDVEEVAEFKAKRAYEILKEPVIVEDTGLYLDRYNGLPGAFIKLVLQKLSNQEFCDAIDGNRKGVVKTCIVFFDGKDSKIFIGETRGEIASSPRGDKGWGWDNFFIPEGGDKTFAEMEPEEKNEVSMRRKAIEKMKSSLL